MQTGFIHFDQVAEVFRVYEVFSMSSVFVEQH